MKKYTANIYGDSIMKGTVFNDELEQSIVMPETLEKINTDFNIDANNRSRFGITIKMGEKLLDRDLKKGLECDYCLIEFGGNDCNYKWDEIAKNPEENHTPLTPLSEFIKTYKSMISKIKKNGIKPVGMSLPPLDATKYFEFIKSRGNDAKSLLKWMGDASLLYRFHEMYSDTAKEMARKAKIPFIDIRKYFLSQRNFKELMCIDGIHPSKKGHELIYMAFNDFIGINI